MYLGAALGSAFLVALALLGSAFLTVSTFASALGNAFWVTSLQTLFWTRSCRRKTSVKYSTIKEAYSLFRAVFLGLVPALLDSHLYKNAMKQHSRKKG